MQLGRCSQTVRHWVLHGVSCNMKVLLYESRQVYYDISTLAES